MKRFVFAAALGCAAVLFGCNNANSPQSPATTTSSQAAATSYSFSVPDSGTYDLDLESDGTFTGVVVPQAPASAPNASVFGGRASRSADEAGATIVYLSGSWKPDGTKGFLITVTGIGKALSALKPVEKFYAEDATSLNLPQIAVTVQIAETDGEYAVTSATVTTATVDANGNVTTTTKEISDTITVSTSTTAQGSEFFAIRRADAPENVQSITLTAGEWKVSIDSFVWFSPEEGQQEKYPYKIYAEFTMQDENKVKEATKAKSECTIPAQLAEQFSGQMTAFGDGEVVKTTNPDGTVTITVNVTGKQLNESTDKEGNPDNSVKYSIVQQVLDTVKSAGPQEEYDTSTVITASADRTKYILRYYAYDGSILTSYYFQKR